MVLDDSLAIDDAGEVARNVVGDYLPGQKFLQAVRACLSDPSNLDLPVVIAAGAAALALSVPVNATPNTTRKCATLVIPPGNRVELTTAGGPIAQRRWLCVQIGPTLSGGFVFVGEGLVDDANAGRCLGPNGEWDQEAGAGLHFFAFNAGDIDAIVYVTEKA